MKVTAQIEIGRGSLRRSQRIEIGNARRSRDGAIEVELAALPVGGRLRVETEGARGAPHVLGVEFGERGIERVVDLGPSIDYAEAYAAGFRAGAGAYHLARFVMLWPPGSHEDGGGYGEREIEAARATVAEYVGRNPDAHFLGDWPEPAEKRAEIFAVRTTLAREVEK